MATTDFAMVAVYLAALMSPMLLPSVFAVRAIRRKELAVVRADRR